MSLQLDYNLDAYERTDDYSGNVLLKVYDMEKGMVLDVLMTPCTLEALRTSIEHLVSEHGAMDAAGNITDLHDYEFIHAKLQAKLDGATAKKAAEKAMYEKERELEVAKRVYEMMMGADFERWYENEFMDHVEGEAGCQDKDEILDDIVKML